MYPATSGDELQFCVTEQAGSAAKDQVVGGATVHTAQEVDVHVSPDGITTDHIILDKKKDFTPLHILAFLVNKRCCTKKERPL